MLHITGHMKVFSGIRPTGKLHLGNYLGAVKNWLKLQDKYDCIYAIVDLHGLTTPFDNKKMPQNTLEVVLDYLALGINPKKCSLIIQSHIPEHLELAWIFGCLTSLAKLQHLPTFKEKIKLHPENVNLGLLSYPVLMAADILIYKADFVPVGKDQLPHIEFTREIARKFNQLFGRTFPESKALLTKGKDIRSLTNPQQKMSKSLGEKSYIALADSPRVIKEKIAKAVTDVGPQKSKKMSPGVANLFVLMEEFSDTKTLSHFKTEYKKGTIKYSEMKKVLAEDIAKAFESFRKKRTELTKKPNYIKEVLKEGEKKARKIAQETMVEVKKKIGLL